MRRDIDKDKLIIKESNEVLAHSDSADEKAVEECCNNHTHKHEEHHRHSHACNQECTMSHSEGDGEIANHKHSAECCERDDRSCTHSHLKRDLDTDYDEHHHDHEGECHAKCCSHEHRHETHPHHDKREKNKPIAKHSESDCSDGCCESEHAHRHKPDKHSHGGCACGCEDIRISPNHSHEHDTMDKKDIIIKLTSVAIAVILIIIGSLVDMAQWGYITIMVAAYLVCGGEYLFQALKNILHGKIFDENFLMSLATIGALALGEYIEAVLVMLLYSVGESFQAYAVMKSKKSISSLMDIKANFANKIVDGILTQVDTDTLEPKDLIVVRQGERIPVDGIITKGNTFIDCSAINGEYKPVSASIGDDVLGGSINNGDAITVEVTKRFEDTTLAKILDLVEHAQDKKPKTAKFITRFAKYYTPAVVLAAAVIAFIPPIFSGYSDFSLWLNKALVFLVISCPCALVISVPLTFFAGIGGASRHGVLVKGGNALESLHRIDTVVFDKTGTLTKGEFNVIDVSAEGIDKETLIDYAAHAEAFSSHPIAASILKYYDRPVNQSEISDYREISGKGVSVEYKGVQLLAGNAALMELNGVAYTPSNQAGTLIYLAADGKFVGSILIGDTLKEGAKQTVEYLKSKNKRVIMMSGDNHSAVKSVAEELGIQEYYYAMLPQDKAAKVESLCQSGAKVLFVGDGINDAPVLAGATLGACVGGVGNDASMEASDIVLIKGSPDEVVSAFKAGSKTRKIVIENIVFALGIKLVIMILSLITTLPMWLAIIADVGVSVLAVLNAMRAMLKERKTY